MRSFKYWLRAISLCLLLIAVSESSYAQTAKVAKSISKIIGNRAAKEAGEAVAEKTIKEISSEMVEKSVTKSTKNSLLSKFTKIYPDTKIGPVSRFTSAIDNRILTDGHKVFDASFKDSRFIFEELVGERLGREVAEKSIQKTLTAVGVEFTGRNAVKALGDESSTRKAVDVLRKYSPDILNTDDLIVNKIGLHHKVRLSGRYSEMVIDQAGVVHCLSDITTGKANEFIEILQPDTKYILDNGLIQLQTDHLGRVVEYECFSSEIRKLGSNLTGRTSNIFPSNIELPVNEAKLRNLDVIGTEAFNRGDDVWVKNTFSYSTNGKYKVDRTVIVKDRTTSKVKEHHKKAKGIDSFKTKTAGKSIFQARKRVFDVADKEALKSGAKELSEKELRERYPELAKYLNDLKLRLGDNEYARSIKVYKNSEYDCLIVEGIDGRVNQASNFMIMKNDEIYARTGNVIGDGHQNEFINNNLMMPNKKIITENIEYRTDELGRVIKTTEVYDPNIPSNRSGSRRDFKEVSNNKGGRSNHVGGHVAPHAIGGPSEAINIVPMDKEFNGSGTWRQMENYVQSAYESNKKVIVEKQISYHPGTQIPDKIKVIVNVDGKIDEFDFVHGN